VSSITAPVSARSPCAPAIVTRPDNPKTPQTANRCFARDNATERTKRRPGTGCGWRGRAVPLGQGVTPPPADLPIYSGTDAVEMQRPSRARPACRRYSRVASTTATGQVWTSALATIDRERAWWAASHSRDASWRTLEGESGFGLARCSRGIVFDQRHVARTKRDRPSGRSLLFGFTTTTDGVSCRGSVIAAVLRVPRLLTLWTPRPWTRCFPLPSREAPSREETKHLLRPAMSGPCDGLRGDPQHSFDGASKRLARVGTRISPHRFRRRKQIECGMAGLVSEIREHPIRAVIITANQALCNDRQHGKARPLEMFGRQFRTGLSRPRAISIPGRFDQRKTYTIEQHSDVRRDRPTVGGPQVPIDVERPVAAYVVERVDLGAVERSVPWRVEDEHGRTESAHKLVAVWKHVFLGAACEQDDEIDIAPEVSRLTTERARISQ
jgi:hypothetical protein